MGFKDWFSRRTALEFALERGMRPGADIAQEVGNLGDYEVRSEADARAICGVLSQLLKQGSDTGGKSVFRTVVGLFQNVPDVKCPAFEVLVLEGIPLLIEPIDQALDGPSRWENSDLLFGVKILAMYGSEEGTDTVVRAARLPLDDDAYLWQVILSLYGSDHPEQERLFQSLSDPLPDGFLAVCLLDSANAAHLEGSDLPHPFDSPAGVHRLEQWLVSTDEDQFSYAVSATAALPHISSPQRDALLALALEHTDPDVQMEAAWTAGKLGRESGIAWLAQCCLDPNRCSKAMQYLEELNRLDAVPEQAMDEKFQAVAEFAQWLAHPHELGRPADELEVIDHRDLPWPPQRESKPMWLIRYRAKDDTGLKADDVDVGLVGSVTFCLFSYALEQRPPEDCYAIHCFWEMEHLGLIVMSEDEEGSTEYDHLLARTGIEGLSDIHLIAVAEMSLPLNYPQTLVALAKAQRHGQQGWVVADGERSRWYAQAEMPQCTFEKIVLMLHIGRVLLGFSADPDRLSYLRPVAAKPPAAQLVAAYEALLDRARQDEKPALALLGSFSPVGSAFEDYVAALAATRSIEHPVATCMAFESLLTIAESSAPSLHPKLFDSCSVLGDAFDPYIAALVLLNRQGEVPSLLEKFRPYWDHNLGYGKLGSAAFAAGYLELAQPLILKLRGSMENLHVCGEMDMLAQIWIRSGRQAEAHMLLLDVMKQGLEKSRNAKGLDRKFHEEGFQARRASYLRLFPEHGEAELARQQIPASTLRN